MKVALSRDVVEGRGGNAGGASVGPGGEVQRRGDEEPDLDGVRKAGETGGTDLGPVDAVGGVVAGDAIPDAGEPQPPGRGRSGGAGESRAVLRGVGLPAVPLRAGG